MQSTELGREPQSFSDQRFHFRFTSIRVNPKRIIFFSVFFLVFTLSGFLTIGNFFPYRMGLVSLFVLPLLFVYGIKFNSIYFVYFGLIFVIILSAIFNGSSMLDFFLFLRILLFSFLIYYLVSIYINQENITNVIRVCIFIAVIQLPIILVQQFIYPYLSNRIVSGISQIDFDFGTFNYKGDASMSFFLSLMVIFLLFDKNWSYITKNRWPIVIWLTITILIANAEVMKLIIGMIWIVFVMFNLNKKSALFAIIAIASVFLLLVGFGVFDQIWSDFSRSFISNSKIDLTNAEKYLTGSYARGSGIAYFLNQEFLWLGDGPSKYYNVLDRERLRGNTGHFFTFYSEIGFLGLFLSFLIFFFIAFPTRKLKIHFRMEYLLMFLSIILLSFTTEVLNDISIVMIYSIMSLTYLIPSQKNLLSKSSKR
jgi:hypothetical protein